MWCILGCDTIQCGSLVPTNCHIHQCKLYIAVVFVGYMAVHSLFPSTFLFSISGYTLRHIFSAIVAPLQKRLITRGSFKMFLESLYFSEIENSKIIKLYFLQNSPPCNYSLLPAIVNVVEAFLEAILWKPFQLFRRILDDVSSITNAPSLRCWFQSSEQVKLSWIQVRRVWRMLQCCYIVLC
jgi:hypothetical protein